MRTGVIKFFLVLIPLLLLVSFSQNSFSDETYAPEKLPSDVRYMLEDMYGADKNKWPALIQEKDLNQDGHNDWVVQEQKCNIKEDCAAEIFICIPGLKKECSEYCYKEVESLHNIKEKLTRLKCESTC